METTTTLQLIFLTENNKTYTLNIADPVQPVDAQEASDVMNYMINNNVITTVNGGLSYIKGVRVVTRSVETIA